MKSKIYEKIIFNDKKDDDIFIIQHNFFNNIKLRENFFLEIKDNYLLVKNNNISKFLYDWKILFQWNNTDKEYSINYNKTNYVFPYLIKCNFIIYNKDSNIITDYYNNIYIYLNKWTKQIEKIIKYDKKNNEKYNLKFKKFYENNVNILECYNDINETY